MALTKVETYAVSIINGSGSKEAKLKKVFKAFEIEYWFANNQRRYKGNIVNGFAGWLSGLPSGIDIPFSYHDIRQTAIKKGFVAKTASERVLSNFEQKWFYMIASAFVSAHRKTVKAPVKKKTTVKRK